MTVSKKVLLAFFAFFCLFLFLTLIFSYDNLNTSKNSHLQKTQRFSLEIGGLQREYFAYKPSLNKGKLPIVIVLHGGGGPLGSAELMAEHSGWLELAENESFIVLFPQGTLDDIGKPLNLNDKSNERNIRTWSNGSGVSASARGVNDVEFIRLIIEDAEKRFNTDEERIYITGFSNGATMTYFLGAELSDKITAIAPVAGLLYSHNIPSSNVSLLNISGEDDRLPKNRGLIPKVEAADYINNPVEAWKKYLNCSDTGIITDKNNIIRQEYKSCNEGSEVVSIIVKNTGHFYPGLSTLFGIAPDIGDKINATKVIWDFFKSKQK